MRAWYLPACGPAWAGVSVNHRVRCWIASAPWQARCHALRLCTTWVWCRSREWPVTKKALTWRCRSQLTALRDRTATAVGSISPTHMHSITFQYVPIFGTCENVFYYTSLVSSPNSKTSATCPAHAVTDHKAIGMQQPEPLPRLHVAVGPAGAQPCIQVGSVSVKDAQGSTVEVIDVTPQLQNAPWQTVMTAVGVSPWLARLPSDVTTGIWMGLQPSHRLPEAEQPGGTCSSITRSSSAALAAQAEPEPALQLSGGSPRRKQAPSKQQQQLPPPAFHAGGFSSDATGTACTTESAAVDSTTFGQPGNSNGSSCSTGAPQPPGATARPGSSAGTSTTSSARPSKHTVSAPVSPSQAGRLSRLGQPPGIPRHRPPSSAGLLASRLLHGGVWQVVQGAAVSHKKHSSTSSSPMPGASPGLQPCGSTGSGGGSSRPGVSSTEPVSPRIPAFWSATDAVYTEEYVQQLRHHIGQLEMQLQELSGLTFSSSPAAAEVATAGACSTCGHLEEQLQQMKQTLQAAQQGQAEARGRADAATAAAADMERSCSQLQQQLAELHGELAASKAAAGAAEAEQQHLQQQVRQLQRAADVACQEAKEGSRQLQEQVQGLEQEVTNARQEAAAVQVQYNRLQQQMEQQETAHSSTQLALQHRMGEVEALLSSSRLDVATAQQQVQDQGAAVADAQQRLQEAHAQQSQQREASEQQLSHIRQQLEQQQAAVADAQLQLQEAAAKLEQQASAMRTMEQKVQELGQQLSSTAAAATAAEERCRALQQQLQLSQQQEAAAQEASAGLYQQIEELEAALVTSKSAAEAAQQECSNMQQQVQEKQAALQAAQAAAAGLEGAEAAMQQQLAALQDQLHLSSSQAAASQAKCSELQQQLQDSQAEGAQAGTALQQLQQQLGQLQEEITRSNCELEVCRSRVGDLEQQLQGAQQARAAAESAQQDLQQLVSRLRGQVDSSSSEAAAAREHSKELEQQLQGAQQARAAADSAQQDLQQLVSRLRGQVDSSSSEAAAAREHSKELEQQLAAASSAAQQLLGVWGEQQDGQNLQQEEETGVQASVRSAAVAALATSAARAAQPISSSAAASCSGRASALGNTSTATPRSGSSSAHGSRCSSRASHLAVQQQAAEGLQQQLTDALLLGRARQQQHDSLVEQHSKLLAQLSASRERSEQLQSRLAGMQSEQQQLHLKVAELTSQQQLIKVEHEQQLQAVTTELQQQLAARSTQKNGLEERLAAAVGQVQELSSQNATLVSRQQELTDAAQQMAALLEQIDRAGTASAAAAAAEHQVQTELRLAAQRQCAAAKAQLRAAQQQVQHVVQDRNAAAAARIALHHQLSLSQEELTAAHQELTQLRTSSSQGEEQLQAFVELQRELTTAQEDLSAAHAKEVQLEQQVAQLQATCAAAADNLRIAVADMKESAASMQQQLAGRDLLLQQAMDLAAASCGQGSDIDGVDSTRVAALLQQLRAQVAAAQQGKDRPSEQDAWAQQQQQQQQQQAAADGHCMIAAIPPPAAAAGKVGKSPQPSLQSLSSPVQGSRTPFADAAVAVAAAGGVTSSSRRSPSSPVVGPLALSPAPSSQQASPSRLRLAGADSAVGGLGGRPGLDALSAWPSTSSLQGAGYQSSADRMLCAALDEATQRASAATQKLAETEAELDQVTACKDLLAQEVAQQASQISVYQQALAQLAEGWFGQGLTRILGDLHGDMTPEARGATTADGAGAAPTTRLLQPAASSGSSSSGQVGAEGGTAAAAAAAGQGSVLGLDSAEQAADDMQWSDSAVATAVEAGQAGSTFSAAVAGCDVANHDVTSAADPGVRIITASSSIASRDGPDSPSMAHVLHAANSGGVPGTLMFTNPLSRLWSQGSHHQQQQDWDPSSPTTPAAAGGAHSVVEGDGADEGVQVGGLSGGSIPRAPTAAAAGVVALDTLQLSSPASPSRRVTGGIGRYSQPSSPAVAGTMPAGALGGGLGGEHLEPAGTAAAGAAGGVLVTSVAGAPGAYREWATAPGSLLGTPNSNNCSMVADVATRPLLLSEPQVLWEAGHPPSDASSSYGRPMRQPQAPLEEEEEQQQQGAEVEGAHGAVRWGLPYLDRLKSHPVLGSSYGSASTASQQ